MTPAEREELVQAKLLIMTKDARSLHNLVKDRQQVQKRNGENLAVEAKQRLQNLAKIRQEESKKRISTIDTKEQERKKISRSLMHNLTTAADYPGCPQYVPHMINILKNILGKFIIYRKKPFFSLD